MKTRIGSGSLSFVIEDRTEELVRAAVERAAPGAARVIEDEIGAIYESARARWPVGPEKRERKGRHSRDELVQELVVERDRIRGRIFNTAPWAKYIKPKGLKGKSAFVELLRKPLRARRDAVVRLLGQSIIAGMEG